MRLKMLVAVGLPQKDPKLFYAEDAVVLEVKEGQEFLDAILEKYEEYSTENSVLQDFLGFDVEDPGLWVFEAEILDLEYLEYDKELWRRPTKEDGWETLNLEDK
jgi:hypothetical protein